jgi:hypothetical protein
MNLLLGILFSAFCFGQAASIYIAPTSAGSNNGASCANAYSYTFFNTSGNWGTGGSQIGGGTTVHLCSGTYTFSGGTSCGLSFQASGTSGNIITLTADQGTVTITAPYWDGSSNGGPICSSGYSYVTINGDNNLTLQATANGSALANQQDYGTCVWALTGDYVTIENLTCSNIYVHVQCVSPYTGCDEGGQNTDGLVAQGSHVTITGNTIHDTKWCVTGGVAGSVTIANRVIANNTIYNCDHGVAMGVASTNGVLNGLYIYGNNICCAANWDDNPSVNNNHHDGIHVWSYDTGDLITGAWVYNNYIHGDWGAGWNSAMFVEATTDMTGAVYFNNLLVDQSVLSHNGCGAMCFENNGITIYNNTFDCSGANGGGSVAIDNYGTGVTIENNTVTACYGALQFQGSGSWTTIDYNNYYNIGSNGWNGGGTLSSWQTSCSCDSHSFGTNPNLNSSHVPNSGSPLIAAGVSLYSVCNGQANPGLGALCYDGNNVAQPSSGAWTIGAFQYVSGGGTFTVTFGLGRRSWKQSFP